MKLCLYCEAPCDETDPDTYHEVVSWVNGPKLDGPKLREQTGRVAHKHCIEKLIRGQAPDQPELLDEPVESKLPLRLSAAGPCVSCGKSMEDCMFETNFVCCGKCEHPLRSERLPRLTDEPGNVIKLTGENSVHSAIQARARELQVQGPDEFPFGYYQDLAAKELSGQEGAREDERDE